MLANSQNTKMKDTILARQQRVPRPLMQFSILVVFRIIWGVILL